MQFWIEVETFAGRTFLGLSRHTIDGGRKPGIASATAPAHGNDQFLAILDQITNDLSALGVPDHRARRHHDPDITASTAGFIGARPGFAAFSTHVAAVVQVEQGIEALFDNQDHTAATAAVTAVGAAAGNELLAPE